MVGFWRGRLGEEGGGAVPLDDAATTERHRNERNEKHDDRRHPFLLHLLIFLLLGAFPPPRRRSSSPQKVYTCPSPNPSFLPYFIFASRCFFCSSCRRSIASGFSDEKRSWPALSVRVGGRRTGWDGMTDTHVAWRGVVCGTDTRWTKPASTPAQRLTSLGKEGDGAHAQQEGRADQHLCVWVGGIIEMEGGLGGAMR